MAWDDLQWESDFGNIGDGAAQWGNLGDVFGDVASSDASSGDWGGGVSSDGGGGWGGIGSGISVPGGSGGGSNPWARLAATLLGPAIGAGAGLIGGAVAPDRPAQIISTPVHNPPTVMDPRTSQGTAAEDMRLQGAQLNQAELQRALADPYGGTLSPQQQSRAMYEISRQIRKANAAAGGLETGGGVAREQQALDAYRRARETERYNYINSRFGSIPSLTSGFTPNQIVGTSPNQLTTIPGEANPWQRIIASAGSAAGRNVGDFVQSQWAV